jgi:hypothetical protein
MATKQQIEAAQRKLDIKDRARRDKMFLATQVLGYDFQPDVHQELFDCYIPFDNTKNWREQSAIKDRMVLWSRGFYKTTSIVVEIIQMILNFPDVRILIMQGSREITQTLLHQIKAHFTGENPRSKLKEYFPEFCADKLGTVDSFTVPARKQKQLAQATVTVASPRTIKTGQHYDAGFFDDLVHDQNYDRPKLLEKIKKDFYMCLPLIDPGCYKYVTGTRYAFGDLYEGIEQAELLNREKTGKHEWVITITSCFLADGYTIRFPERTLPDGRVIGISREELEKKQRDDPGMFSSQYLNRPLIMGTQTFTEAKMLSAVIAEKDTPALSQACLFIDLASSQNEANNPDDSVILAGKTDSLHNIYVVDGIGDRWGSPALAINIIEMALKHRPLRIFIEHSPAAPYFLDYLNALCRQKNINLPIELLKMDNRKDAKAMRISSLEGFIRLKKLRFFVDLPCWEKMFHQFTKWPKAPYGHDDYPDTVGLMVKRFTEALGPGYAPKELHPLLQAVRDQEAQNRQLLSSPSLQYQDNCAGDDFCC